MKIKLSLILIIANIYISYSQNYFVDWIKTLPISDNNWETEVATTDEKGNIYTLSNIQLSGKDFDPSQQVFNVTTKKKTDLLFQKFSPEGKLIWSQMAIDSGNCSVNKTKAFGSNLYTLGNYTGWYQLDYFNNSDTIPGTNNLNVLANYSTVDGSLKNILYNSPTFVPIKYTLDSNGVLWVAAIFSDSADIMPGPGVHTIYGNNSSTNLVICKIDSNLNLLNHYILKRQYTIFINDITTNGNGCAIQFNLTTSANDTVIFNQDTSTSAFSSLPIIVKLDDTLGVKGAIFANNGAIFTSVCLGKSELLFSGENLYNLNGMIDTSFTNFYSNYRIKLYENNQTEVFYDANIKEQYISYQNGQYITRSGTNLIFRDSITDTIVDQYTPTSNLSNSFTISYNYDFGSLYLYGEYYDVIEFSRDSIPFTFYNSKTPKSEFYFGKLNNQCNTIIDNTVYPTDQIQCGVLLIDEEVNVAGNGLRYMWVNTRKSDTITDVQWFDSPNGIEQFIRGSKTPYLKYQWDVEYGSIEGVFNIHITDGCGNNFITDSIVIKAYGIPTVVGATTVLPILDIGDTVLLDVLAVNGFDTVKYNWVKEQFFLFDYQPFEGTSTTQLKINGITQDKAGLYSCVAWHPQCPQYYGESIANIVIVGEDTNVNWNDWNVGVNELEELNITIYPTIVSDYLSFNSDENQNFKTYIFNNSGKIERSFTWKNNEKIDLKNLSPGIYFVTVIAKDKKKTIKIIKS